jgi:hypothetical protein
MSDTESHVDDEEEGGDAPPPWLQVLARNVCERIDTGPREERGFSVEALKAINTGDGLDFQITIHPHPVPGGFPCMHVDVGSVSDLFDEPPDIDWHPCHGVMTFEGEVNGSVVVVEIHDEPEHCADCEGHKHEASN